MTINVLETLEACKKASEAVSERTDEITAGVKQLVEQVFEEEAEVNTHSTVFDSRMTPWTYVTVGRKHQPDGLGTTGFFNFVKNKIGEHFNRAHVELYENSGTLLQVRISRSAECERPELIIAITPDLTDEHLAQKPRRLRENVQKNFAEIESELGPDLANTLGWEVIAKATYEN